MPRTVIHALLEGLRDDTFPAQVPSYSLLLHVPPPSQRGVADEAYHTTHKLS